jgi:alpha-tubulin suppressor-like RCC1 family protein
MPRSFTLLCLVVTILLPRLGFAQSTVAGGGAFTLVVKSDGTVWAFGLNNNGQLGINSLINNKTPIQIPGLSGVTTAAAGGLHSMALTSSGALRVWGDNLYGQVGDASTTDRKTPVLLSLANVTAIAAGEFHSLALTSNGNVYAWGRNNFGQIGNGNTTNVNVPTLVLTGAIAIGAGRNHSLAVKTDGTAWAWGANGSGQLSNNTTSTGATSSPVQMQGITNASKAIGGEAHSLLILNDGTVKGAGENTAGQLGDSTSTDRWIAVTVGSLTNVSRLASGLDSSFAMLGDGSLWVWGENGGGQLGLGTSTDAHAPVELTSLTGTADVAAGWSHSIVIDTNGVVSTWGANASSQLGDGTVVARSAPTPISAAAFDWRVATPVFSVAAGIHNVDKTVTLTVDTLSASICYTQSGTDPTESDTCVNSGGSAQVTYSQTLKARAFKAGMPASEITSAIYTMVVATPTATSSGVFTNPQNLPTLTFATTTTNTSIRYTTDGVTNPTETSGEVYAGSFQLAHTTTFKIIAFRSGWSSSTIRTASFTMNFGTLTAPTIETAAGAYTGSVSVVMSSPQSFASIRYTTGNPNNAVPLSSSLQYSGPLPVSATTTIRAKAFHPDYTTSVEATSKTYTITTHTPVLDTAAGSYAPGSAVTITAGQPLTDTLRMTIDGTDPTTTSRAIASGTTLLLGNFTLKVRAWRTGATESAIANAAYTLTAPLGPGAADAGSAHNMVVTPDGRVYAFGENGSGQLGDDSLVDRPTPTLLNTITGVTSISSGLAHTLARTWDDQVYSWGSNTSGRLGDGTTSGTRKLPYHIPTLSNVIAIAAGDAHSLALTSGGHVYSWGENSDGQLGLGSTLDTPTPTEIPGLSGIVAIAAGDTHSMALTASGSLYVWGNDANSRLGDGLTADRTSPFPLGLIDVAAIAAGDAHSLAMLGNGAVYSWGLGTSGQLGRGNTSSSTTPTLIPGLWASAIAAAGSNSAAVRFDGVLVAWGDNSSGQIGDTTSPTDRLQPTTVVGPASVSSLSLGDFHSMVVTPSGELWTWGDFLSGRLGDNSTADRPTPASVMSGIANWAPAAPTVSAPSQTFSSAQTVTLLSSTAGAVIRYNLTGTDPTASDAEVPAGGVEIAYSSLLRAKAFADGRLSGSTARADYQLQSAAPTINPPTATYTSAQSVTMSVTGPPSTIRYTLDGSDPTASSTAYTGAFTISTLTTVKARAFPTNGWAASSATNATLTFNYGTLDPPTASPNGGIFAAAPQVTLTSISGATIRYTLNGTTPTGSSTLYTGPITIAAGGQTVKSIAFHPDWTASAVRSDTYTVDSTAPTIVATRFPLPMGNWQLTPVAVSFVCSDNIGIATCTSPVTISQEGSGQTLTGTAVDQVGRQTTTQEIVNVDLTSPLVTLTSPVDGGVTTNSSVTISAAVSDALSGLGVVKCNGVDTPVVDGVVTCTATLRPGRNSITVSARDVAGNSRSAGATITLAGTPSNLILSPAVRTMLVGETATLSLRDNFGVPAPAATWDSSDPSVVSLSADDPPVLTALASGTATIQALRNGLSAVATLTVVAGESLPEGTTRWNVAPTPGGGFSWLEGPIYTNRMAGNDPDLFMVETNTTTWERRLRAMSSESGEVAWLATSPGVPLMGDMLGGVIAGIEPSNNYCVGPFNEIQRCYIGLARVAASAETAAWRYDSPGMLDRPAQGPDGTVYVIEHLGDYLWMPNDNGNAYFPFPGEKALVILDGATGEVTARVPLEGDPNREPVTVGPIVGGDGYGYILVAKGLQLTLRKVSREGAVAETVIVSGTSCSSNCIGPVPSQLLPDGLGGLLVTASWNMTSQEPYDFRLTRLDGSGGRTDTPINFGRIAMIGRGGFAYVGGAVMDLLTLTTSWSLPVGWTFLAATPGGGAVAENDAGDIAHFDETGQLLRTILAVGLRNPVQGASGLIGASGLATNTPLGLRKVEGRFEDATYFSVRFALRLYTAVEQYAFGNQPGNLAPPQERFPWLRQGAPDIGPHEAIYDALDDLIQRLTNDDALRERALEVLHRVRPAGEKNIQKVNEFVTYLKEHKPHFYDGTRSTMCYGTLTGGPDRTSCRFIPDGWFWNWFSVQHQFESDPKDVALSWLGVTPPHVFFNPAYIGLEAQGKNIGNESVIFHEVLHAWTGKSDDELRDLLEHLPPPSCSITEKIRVEVLYGAPGLNSQEAYPSCIPVP